MPIRFLINQCQIITFLILIDDNIENSRIELRGIVLPVQMGGLLGGPKGMLAPPLKLLGGGGLALLAPLFLRLCLAMHMKGRAYTTPALLFPFLIRKGTHLLLDRE